MLKRILKIIWGLKNLYKRRSRGGEYGIDVDDSEHELDNDNDQNLDFDDKSSFFPCEIDDATQHTRVES